MAASHIQKFKVSIITLTGRDDDVYFIMKVQHLLVQST